MARRPFRLGSECGQGGKGTTVDMASDIAASGLSSLTALAGRWRLSRIIRHRAGQEARLEGQTRFAWKGRQLCQDETGLLTIGSGPALKATRRYVWRQRGGLLEVFFDDGRPFHTVPVGAIFHETVHLCAPDRYAVAYDFSDWPVWYSRWTVEGPRKDYVMDSTYTRLSPEAT